MLIHYVLSSLHPTYILHYVVMFTRRHQFQAELVGTVAWSWSHTETKDTARTSSIFAETLTE